jgi:CRISPR-associated endonuclease/helicase Cas3
MIYAHSLPGHPNSEWEPLQDHLRLVAKRCSEFAVTFGCAETAWVAGLLHDLGKCSPDFQAYIAQTVEGANTRGPDHSTAGAREARRAFGDKLGTAGTSSCFISM